MRRDERVTTLMMKVCVRELVLVLVLMLGLGWAFWMDVYQAGGPRRVSRPFMVFISLILFYT